MRAIWILGVVAAAAHGVAWANPNLAASGRYVCADGSLASIDFPATGPELEWRGRSVRMAAVASFGGFRFRGDDISISGGGTVGYRTLKINQRGAKSLACRSIPPQATAGIATGAVTWRQRIAMPAGMTVTVELRDTARADAPAPLLARTVLVTRGNQAPLWWRLDYDRKKLGPMARPALSARIADGKGQLRWISDTFTPLPVSGSDDHPEAEIVVVPVRAEPSPSSR
jgi:putative lipoprotein